MKCPCCNLVIEDEHRHIDRCHPELLRRRWTEAGISVDEINRRLHFASRHFPIEDTVDDLIKRVHMVEIMAASVGFAVKIHETAGGKVFTGSGETMVAALCLAIDRMKYQ
jgi:hypothetical protein